MAFFMNKVLLCFSISTLGIASIQTYFPNAVSAQQTNIDTLSLCGNWQAIPGSGDFIYGPEDFPVKKTAGKVHATVNYDIHTVGSRTFRVTKTVSIETPLKVDGSRHSGSTTETVNALAKYHGAVQGDSLYLTEDTQYGIQKWLRLPGNKFDVIVLNNGRIPSASHYTVEQTSRRTCK